MSIEDLKKRLLEITRLKAIEQVLQWDQETYMPEGGGHIRAEHISSLSSLAHRLHTGEEFRSVLCGQVFMDSGEPQDSGVDAETRRLLYLVWKDHHDAIALPPDFVEEMALHASRSQQVWAKARMENDYAAFSPYLEKMIDLKKREADYYGSETTPYDALLDKFEPGMTEARITELFDEMREPLVRLVRDIGDSGTVIDEGPLKAPFSLEKQWTFGLRVAEAMGFDLRRGRQDKSAHPFTTSFHPTDVRITTRLKADDFKSGFFATVHETGHGLYEQGLPVEQYGTPFGEAVSFGFHESQSRLWENQVARGRLFWKHFYPLLRGQFPGQLGDVDPEDFYRMVNTVTPSLIRVEADEVTYTLHIMLRFEIEKMLINGDLSVEELPEVWNRKTEDYLGIRPRDFKDGVMQDIHWSMGAFGYFPTYALGNLYAAPLMAAARRDLVDLDERIGSGDLRSLRQWLLEKVHSRGRRLAVEDLIMDITGAPLSSKPFLEYLEAKYTDIYRLKGN